MGSKHKEASKKAKTIAVTLHVDKWYVSLIPHNNNTTTTATTEMYYTIPIGLWEAKSVPRLAWISEAMNVQSQDWKFVPDFATDLALRVISAK